jgi:hypothetical protein
MLSLTKEMEAQRNELLELVEKNGWKATELDNYDFHKYSKETWLLESIWSPIGLKVYVNFPLDFINYEEKKAWAIEVSEEKPIYGQQRKCFMVSLKQWKNEKNDFLKFLEELRNRHNVEG